MLIIFLRVIFLSEDIMVLMIKKVRYSRYISWEYVICLCNLKLFVIVIGFLNGI